VTECFDEALGGLMGPFTERITSEGGITVYNIRLLESFNTNTSQAVVKISSSSTKCALSNTELTFTSLNWSVDQIVDVSVVDDGAFNAKGSISYSCTLTHTIQSTDTRYLNVAPVVSTLKVSSAGCGEGEHLGLYTRGNGGKQCICSHQYFLPPTSNCVPCPNQQAVCNELGLTAPPVAATYWRYDPTSPDLQAYPFYECPFSHACVGGNGTNGRCVEGHDNNGPLCATCTAEYVLQQSTCIFCEGRTDTKAFSGDLLSVVAFGFVFFTVGTYFMLTQPDLSGEETKDLKTFKKISIRQSEVETSVYISEEHEHVSKVTIQDISEAK
jgi:hypothetical protein